MSETLNEMIESIYGKPLPLEESNALATKIFEEGGTWLVDGYSRQVEVTPIGFYKSWNGRILVVVKALKGKPWREKTNYGEGRTFTSGTNIKNVRPQDLSKKEEN
jgi:hypothetical protein